MASGKRGRGVMPMRGGYGKDDAGDVGVIIAAIVVAMLMLSVLA